MLLFLFFWQHVCLSALGAKPHLLAFNPQLIPQRHRYVIRIHQQLSPSTATAPPSRCGLTSTLGRTLRRCSCRTSTCSRRSIFRQPFRRWLHFLWGFAAGVAGRSLGRSTRTNAGASSAPMLEPLGPSAIGDDNQRFNFCNSEASSRILQQQGTSRFHRCRPKI